MAGRHVATHVKPEHHPAVAQALLEAIRDVLGAEIATDEILDAWAEAHGVLIAQKAELYAAALEQA